MPREIFKTKDPHDREIHLLEGTWKYHIVQSHPEITKMKNPLIKIQETIEDPNLILERQSTITLIYATMTPIKQYFNVYVRFDDITYTAGKIITAHLSNTNLAGNLLYLRK
jgi:hypothetical protein